MEESDPEDMEPDIVGLWLTLVDSVSHNNLVFRQSS